MKDYPNMSYCQFENTVSAIRQCLSAMADENKQTLIDEMSSREKKAYEQFCAFLQFDSDEDNQVQAAEILECQPMEE